jgi:hypothetical protein
MSSPLLTPDRLAALHDAARLRAHELRHEAITDLTSRVATAIAGVMRRIRDAAKKKGVPHGTPFGSERRNAV